MAALFRTLFSRTDLLDLFRELFSMNDTKKCKNCHGNNFVDDLKQNFRKCTTCGVVNGCCDQQSQTFDQSQQNNHSALHENLGSYIPKKHKLLQMRAVRETNSKAQNRMKNLQRKLERIVEKLQICERVKVRASSLMFKSLENKKMRRIKKDELLAAVSIVLAAREARIQYTFREISESCENVSKKEICRVYKIYERVLNKQEKNQIKKLDVEKIRFSSMISRFASILCIDFLNQKKIRRLFAKINSSPELSTLNPLTRLASAIYLTMGQEKENCRDVSLACSVSEHTILRSAELVLEII